MFDYEFKVGDIVKSIANNHCKYKITKINIRTVWVETNDNNKFLYKGVRKEILVKI